MVTATGGRGERRDGDGVELWGDWMGPVTERKGVGAGSVGDVEGDGEIESDVGTGAGVVTTRARAMGGIPRPMEGVRPSRERSEVDDNGLGGIGSESRCEVAKNMSVFELLLNAGLTAPSPCGVDA